ncbi:MAG: hypothetical protein NZT92_00045 [Abditibacteriales bacterium]|nr:hypothetical protein [Abditibacteriales bacterium]MDW8364900.1 hypothetical protein [Abditibacteriales bacterium]
MKFLFDVEGPSNAIVRREPHRPKGDAYWEERHADKFVSQLKCRYFRVQAEIDHAQGRDLTIAFDLLEAARGRPLRVWLRSPAGAAQAGKERFSVSRQPRAPVGETHDAAVTHHA